MTVDVLNIAQSLINELSSEVNHRVGMIEGVRELYVRIKQEVDRQTIAEQGGSNDNEGAGVTGGSESSSEPTSEAPTTEPTAP